MSKMRVLIIDDSKEDRFLIKNNISKSKLKNKVNIEESDNLFDAFSKLKNQKIDSIILDLCLIETSGIETINTITDFLKKIKKNIPIIVLTQLEDYKIGRKALEMGIKDFLIKEEISPQELARSLTFANYFLNIKKRKIANK